MDDGSIRVDRPLKRDGRTCRKASEPRPPAHAGGTAHQHTKPASGSSLPVANSNKNLPEHEKNVAAHHPSRQRPARPRAGEEGGRGAAGMRGRPAAEEHATRGSTALPGDTRKHAAQSKPELAPGRDIAPQELLSKNTRAINADAAPGTARPSHTEPADHAGETDDAPPIPRQPGRRHSAHALDGGGGPEPGERPAAAA